MTNEQTIEYIASIRMGMMVEHSLDVAVDTMRKYQKITEIVKSWRENGLDYDSCDAMENIERVIEDGNNN